jgi:hypothetical protein
LTRSQDVSPTVVPQRVDLGTSIIPLFSRLVRPARVEQKKKKSEFEWVGVKEEGVFSSYFNLADSHARSLQNGSGRDDHWARPLRPESLT